MRPEERNHLSGFKAKVVLAAIKSDRTLAALASNLMCTRTKFRTRGNNCLIKLSPSS
jgi:hypothetical protein